MQIDLTVRPGVPQTGESGPSFYFDPSAYKPRLAELEDVAAAGVVIDDVGGVLANLDIAASVGRNTTNLGIIATHWPDLVSPVISARQIAVLDARLRGRLSLRIDIAQAQRGDGRIVHEAACRKVDEYLTLLFRLWSNDRPFDHEGEFYSVRGGFVPDKGPQRLALPVRLGGQTGAAVRVAARHASVFELAYGSPDQVAIQVERMRNVAATFGRAKAVRFALALPLKELSDLVRSGGANAPSRLARYLLPYVRLGVSEIMVLGLGSRPLMELLGARVLPALRQVAGPDGGGAGHWGVPARQARRRAGGTAAGGF